MTLEVVDPGLLTTVQDLGRHGLGRLGVSTGGAADTWSLAAANLLLGNQPGAAGLELTLLGPSLRVIEPTAVALAGADLGAEVVDVRGADHRLVPGRSRALAPGDVVRFAGAPAAAAGIRAYLAVPGGFDVPIVLGSRSTALAAGFGGLEGRAIRSGDRLIASGRLPRDPGAAWPPAAEHPLAHRGRVIRVVAGPDAGSAPGSLDALVGREWTVRPESDRMGLRLDGLPLDSAGDDRITVPTAWGAVQLPPDGRPIVLLADHQPTGGYPLIAVAISADRPILGQLGPGAAVRFELVGADEALAALRSQDAALRAAAAAIARDQGWDELWRHAGA